MFDRPGEKIKSFAVVFFALVILGGLISGIALIVEEGFLIGLGVFLATLVFAYLSGLFLSGFGALIQSSEENEAHNREILMILKKANDNGFFRPAPVPAPAAAPAAKAVAQAREEVRTQPGEETVGGSEPAAVPAAVPVRGGGLRLPNGGWRCVCGADNAKYVSTCACGRNKRDVLV